MRICSIFGNANIEKKIDRQLLFNVFLDLIQYHAVDVFYLGYLGDFDVLCRSVLNELKEYYPHLQRVFCVWDKKLLTKRPSYYPKKDFDDFILLPFAQRPNSRLIYNRNCAMIDKSDFVLFYVEEREEPEAIEAVYTYAKLKKKRLMNVCLSNKERFL